MGFFNPFFRQILPLSFNSDFKKDNGSFQKLFPKNFFWFNKTRRPRHGLGLRSKASERVARAKEKKVKIHHFLNLDFE
jgi:hypothetical protein